MQLAQFSKQSARQVSPAHGIKPGITPLMSHDWSEKALQRTWRTFGTLCVAVGVVNAFIPLLPTTVFLLIGLWAYGKGDPEMRQRLLQHPRFGAPLRLWVEKRQITRKGKLGAIGGILLSTAFTATMIGPKPITWAIVAGLVGLSAYLATREEPPHLTA
jgi:uncharacterized membrane protein YbaN (DUF454 family)